MKRIVLIALLFIAVCGAVSAQSNHVLKAKVHTGYVLPFHSYKGLPEQPAVGGEFAYELLPLGLTSWEKHWGYPVIGFGVLGLDLGSPKRLGMMMAVYPYISWKFKYKKVFEFGLKLGTGAAFFNKISTANGAYTSLLFNTGLDFQFNINPKCAIAIELGSNHTTNGEIAQPNSTMNMIYGNLGFRYRLGKYYYSRPKYHKASDLKYKFMINATVSCGFRNFEVGKGTEIQSTLHFDVLWKITNCYATGPALDFFFIPGGSRLGLTYANAFTIGRVTGILDGGIYLYDKQGLKLGRKLPFFYGFKTLKEDGWLYLRAGLRVRLIDNLYAQATIKTHVQRFDFVELGIGYSIPYKKDRAHANRENSSINRYNYHYRNR